MKREKERSTRRGRARRGPAGAGVPGAVSWPGASRAGAAGLAAALAVVSVLAFARVFSYDFVAFDDVEAIVQRPEFNPPTLAALGRFWTLAYSDLYTPMLWTGWWVLAFLGRSAGGSWDATPYHAFNVFAHAGAAVIAFLVLRRVLRADVPALVGAAVFALHPLQVESVAWVSGMKTPLSGLFALWAAWHYLVYSDLAAGDAGDGSPIRPAGGDAPDVQSISRDVRRRAWLHYGVGTVAFLLALITKPTVIVMPLVLATLDGLLRGRPLRRLALPLGLWLALGLFFSWLNVSVQTAVAVYLPTPGQRVLVALDSASFYLRKFVAPVPLVPDYGRTPQSVVEGGALRYGWVLVTIVSLAALVAWRRAPWLLAGVVLFLLGGATTFGLIPFDYQVYSTVADRYAYLSLLGGGVVAAYATRWALGRWRRKTVYFATGGVAFALAVLTFVQCGYWSDTVTLAEHTLRHNRSSLVAYRSLAFEASERGDAEATLAACRAGLAARPGDPELLQWAGNVALAQNRPDEAAAAFRQALERARVNRPHLMNGLGIALAQAKRFGEAEAVVAEALRADPTFALGHENLGILYAQQGQTNRAAREFKAALAIDPSLPRARAVLQQLEATARPPGVRRN